jgi:hypothetical protein
MLTPPVDMLRGGGMHMHLEGGGPYIPPTPQKKIKKIIIQNPSQAQIQMKITLRFFFFIFYVNYCCVVEVGRRKVHLLTHSLFFSICLNKFRIRYIYIEQLHGCN